MAMNDNALFPAGHRARVVTLLRSTAHAFDRVVEGLSDEAWRHRPAPDRWSLFDTTEHLVLVEIGSGKYIARKLAAAPAAPEVLAETEGKEAVIEASQADPTRRTAPEFVKPVGTWPTPEAAVQAFRDNRARTIRFFEETPLDLALYAAPHVSYGPLNGWQWGLFLGLHLIRHLDQMEELRRAVALAPPMPDR